MTHTGFRLVVSNLSAGLICTFGNGGEALLLGCFGIILLVEVLLNATLLPARHHGHRQGPESSGRQSVNGSEWSPGAAVADLRTG